MLWLMLKPLDVIELSVAVGAWEAGTIATVLEVASGSALAEVSDEDGRTLDVLTVPLEAATRLGGQDVPRRPGASELGAHGATLDAAGVFAACADRR
jgi:hypothetical protein